MKSLTSVILRTIAFVMIACSAAFSESPELIPRAALFAPAENDLRISPDGTRYIQGRAFAGLFRYETIESIDGSQPTIAIELETKGVIADAWWTYDVDRIILLHRSALGTQLLSYSLDQGKNIALNQASKDPVAIVRLSKARPHEVLVRVVRAETFEFIVANLRTGEHRTVLNTKELEYVYFDEHFRPRIAVRPDGVCGREILIYASNGNWRHLRTLACDRSNVDRRPGAGVQEVLGVDAKGETLYLTDFADRDKSALLAIDLATGVETELASDAQADILPEVLVNPASGEPIAATSQMGDLRYHPLDETTKEDLGFLRAQFGTPIELTQQSLDGRTWIATPLNGAPPFFHAFNRTARKITPLFSMFPAMDTYALAQRHTRIVETRDGLEIPIHVYLPRDADADGDGIPDVPLPTLIYIHGGPDGLISWDDWSGRSVRSQQLLANRGYAAVRIEFRGAGGRGKTFLEMKDGNWGTSALNDVIDIKDHLEDVGIAARNKIGLWGHSYGGYLSLTALALAPDDFACAFAWSALTSLEAFVAHWADTPYAALMRQEIGDERSDSGRAALRAESPLHNVDRISKPVLMVHGGKDHLRPEIQVQPFVDTMTALGKAITYMLFPNETHGFSQTRNWQTTWAVAESFFAQHLGGRAQPLGRDYPSRAAELRAGFAFVRGSTKAN